MSLAADRLLPSCTNVANELQTSINVATHPPWRLPSLSKNRYGYHEMIDFKPRPHDLVCFCGITDYNGYHEYQTPKPIYLARQM